MKRYILILAAMLSCSNIAMAQKSEQSVLGAKVNIQDFEYQADSVKISFEYDLEDLDIKTNESAIFTPKIYKGDNTLSLPTVVVKRRGGARSYNRAVKLGNRKSVNEYNEMYGEEYKVVDYYGRDKQEREQYSVTVPYESWMVNSQLYVDCSTYGCCKREDGGMLIPENNVLMIDIPSVNEYAVTPDVELVKPEKVAIKRRDIQYSSSLIFRVNSTYIDPNLEGNRAELESIDTMMQSVISDSDYTITKVNIIGFASPEGKLASNMKLSKGRAGALETLMKRKYKMIDPSLYSVEFGGENWGKLYEIVKASDIEYRDEVLSIIDNIPIENGREKKLMNLNGGKTYKYLLRNIFPSTRLVLIDVEYNIDAYDIVRIGELIDTKPQNLSLEEMYRLSETVDIDDPEFEKIFMTAVKIYSDDEVAQNNALVTEIKRGNIGNVSEIADRVDRQTNSAELANSLGAYYMMSGDYDSAKAMLNRAIELGSTRAENNLSQLTAKLKNIEQIKESEAFRAKIYGE